MEIGETSDNNKEVSKVSVSIIKGKITCPLCNEFFKEATTICECLHNFCKACIHDKIINENLKCCPQCKVDLGTNPLNKLRKDNSLQSITDKVSLLIIDAKKSKNQVQSSQANVVINKASNLQYQRKENKQTSSLLDNLLPNASTHNVSITTNKRSTPRRIRKTTTPLKLPTIIEPSQRIDQSCIKKSTSSIPSSSKNVCNDNDKEVSKQQTNVKEKHKGTGSLVIRRLYDLNKLPSIMEEDEDTIMEDITIPNDSNFENKTKDDKASTKKISALKQIDEKPNFVEKTMEVKLPLNIDLNKLPSTFYIGESSSPSNNLPPIANASSHLYNNNENTSDTKGEEMKEIIYIDDDDDDEDCILLGWLQGEQPNLQLNNKINVNEICEVTKDCNEKGKGKIVNYVNEDEQPLSVISSKLVKKARGKRQKKVVQTREVKQPKFVQPIDDIVVDVTTTRSHGTTMMPIWFALVSSKDKEEDKQLPQISPKHFRITDENMPISSIKTYIAKKVGLVDAYEVEIMLRGHPVVSSLSLHSVLDIWCQTATTKPRTIQTTIGSSADDFVMILTYARK